MGRPRKPTALRVLQGNPSRRPLNSNEPQPEQFDEPPPPPDFLEAQDARDEWNRLAPWLHRTGLLTHVDITPLAAYCQAFERWCKAERALIMMGANDMLTGGLMVKTSKNTPIFNPMVGIANKAMSLMVSYATEFGFTPAARSRISAGPFPKGPSKFDGLLAG